MVFTEWPVSTNDLRKRLATSMEYPPSFPPHTLPWSLKITFPRICFLSAFLFNPNGFQLCNFYSGAFYICFKHGRTQLLWNLKKQLTCKFVGRWNELSISLFFHLSTDLFFKKKNLKAVTLGSKVGLFWNFELQNKCAESEFGTFSILILILLLVLFTN